MIGKHAHRSVTLLLSLVMAVLGVALLVEAVGGDGSVLSPRMLLGILFLAAGVGRFYVETRRGRSE
jgi:predicted membrane channel-forming protein YqfA (hemolysin III family)